MKTTRKNQLLWISQIVEDLPADLLNETGDPWNTTAENIRNCSRNSRGGNYYGTQQKAAEHFLRGCGLYGFPIYDEEHRAQLLEWGYSEESAKRNAPRFWSVSAGLLVDALNAHGFII